MQKNDFIAALPSLAAFRDLSKPELFTPLPDDWCVFCCDVANSTRAIEQGRYKVVNMVGAACIMAAINASPMAEIAYVFGGDGATLAVPSAVASDVEQALARTKYFAETAFHLELRVGAVPVQELRRRGAEVRIAMLELSPGNRVALFAGGGVQLTDRLIKHDKTGRWLIAVESEWPELSGLSCRWEPLAARQGTMLCLLISATSSVMSERAEVYAGLLKDIESILAPHLEQARPVRADNMRFRWPPRGLSLELEATCGTHPRWTQRLQLYASSFFQLLAERYDKQIGAYNAPIYRHELRTNSDYRRYDDVLRMVIDVTPQQQLRIESVLKAAYSRAEIIYGTHSSRAAMMTCLLFSLETSRHLHFVDGTEGGFTYAARAMKAQAGQRHSIAVSTV